MAVNGQQHRDTRLPQGNDAAKSVTQHGFRIITRKLPILKAEPIERMTSRLGITPPEMIFGDNEVTIEHLVSGWGITFNAFDALDKVDKTGARCCKLRTRKNGRVPGMPGL